MKAKIHPEYVEATVHCACGFEYKTYSTRKELKVDICSQCHPFYTGKSKMIDSAGRVERFRTRFGETKGTKVLTAKEKAKKVEEDKVAKTAAKKTKKTKK